LDELPTKVGLGAHDGASLTTLHMVDTSFPMQQLSSTQRLPRAPSRHSRLDALLLILFLTGMGALLLRGWQFYALSVGERVDHEDFRVLGPSGSLGQYYGIAGTVLIFTNLLYLVRRRFARLSVGSLRTWLDVHAFTGLFGGMLVVFHSAFQARSTISLITLGSLFAVIATGIVGRFLHSLAPRPDLQLLDRQLALLDRVGPGMGKLLKERMGHVPSAVVPGRGSLLAVLSALPSFWQEDALRRAMIHHTVVFYGQRQPAVVAQLAAPIAECTRLFRAEVRARAATALLRSWRSVHRLAALLMVCLVVLHIGIAWYYGVIWAVAG
jgi:hypothetical protein